MIGQLLDRRYLITQRLSSGGFGETYLAQDTRIPGNPLCVVKQLRSASNNPRHLEKAKQLFNREAEALAQLGNHEQIPRLLAYFTESDEFYLVQEFIEGQTLEVELQPGRIWTEDQVMQLLQEVLTVLIFVHSRGVIHRDIKPANLIRRQQDGKLVLIDFGAIKQVRIQPDGSGEFSVAAPGTRIGTIGYMPTEQARGKPRPNSDIYALGMIAIQALAGVHPSQFEDDSQTGEVLWQHRIQASPPLVEVLRRMTRYNFRDRFQTAASALQGVQQLLQSTPFATGGTKSDPVMDTVHELTLEWAEAGQLFSKTIYPQQYTRHPGCFRIGRDPVRCDIVLSDITVSGLHVELFFNPADQRFYIRNLRETNPPLVDGQPLPQGERQLHLGSSLRLGQVELRVTAIDMKQYLPDQSPLLKSEPPTPTPEPITPIGKSAQAMALGNFQPPVAPDYRPEVAYPGQEIEATYPPQPSPIHPQGEPPSHPSVETTQSKHSQPGWQFGVLWVSVTLVGSAIGLGILSMLANSPATGALAGLLMGTLVGTGQWLLLRQWLASVVGWIPVLMIAEAIGLSLVDSSPAAVIGLVVGGLAGVGQWFVLRGKVPQAAAWIAVKTFADVLAFAVSFSLPGLNYSLVGVGIGLLDGVLTGSAMIWLLRQFLASRAEANS